MAQLKMNEPEQLNGGQVQQKKASSAAAAAFFAFNQHPIVNCSQRGPITIQISNLTGALLSKFT